MFVCLLKLVGLLRPLQVILELTAKTGIGGEVGLNPGPWTVANGWSIRGGRLAADLGYNLDGGVYWGTKGNAGGKTSLRIDVITPNLEFNLILVSKKTPAS
uniref:Uncharacterized protein n=1 Tax=Chrysotila carterae TaxID=13221 RepID=A0A7S4B118_CHRCT|eukprot:6208295-Pleurochrysis_carterae.AAC.2